MGVIRVVEPISSKQHILNKNKYKLITTISSLFYTYDRIM